MGCHVSHVVPATGGAPETAAAAPAGVDAASCPTAGCAPKGGLCMQHRQCQYGAARAERADTGWSQTVSTSGSVCESELPHTGCIAVTCTAACAAHRRGRGEACDERGTGEIVPWHRASSLPAPAGGARNAADAHPAYTRACLGADCEGVATPTSPASDCEAHARTGSCNCKGPQAEGGERPRTRRKKFTWIDTTMWLADSVPRTPDTAVPVPCSTPAIQRFEQMQALAGVRLRRSTTAGSGVTADDESGGGTPTARRDDVAFGSFRSRLTVDTATTATEIGRVDWLEARTLLYATPTVQGRPPAHRDGDSSTVAGMEDDGSFVSCGSGATTGTLHVFTTPVHRQFASPRRPARVTLRSPQGRLAGARVGGFERGPRRGLCRGRSGKTSFTPTARQLGCSSGAHGAAGRSRLDASKAHEWWAELNDIMVHQHDARQAAVTVAKPLPPGPIA